MVYDDGELPLERVLEKSEFTDQEIVLATEQIFRGQRLADLSDEQLAKALMYVRDRRWCIRNLAADPGSVAKWVARLRLAQSRSGGGEGRGAHGGAGSSDCGEVDVYLSGGPPVVPLPWLVQRLAHAVRPLLSAQTARRLRHCGEVRVEVRQGVTLVWSDTRPAPPTPLISSSESVTWLFFHGVGGFDLAALDNTVRHCGAMQGSTLCVPVLPNWESYTTVANHEAASLPLTTTKEWVRIIGAALRARGVAAVNAFAFSLGGATLKLFMEVNPDIGVRHAVLVDPATVPMLAMSGWRWLQEPSILVTAREFHARGRALGLGRWATGGWTATAPLAWFVDVVFAIVVACGLRTDHLRICSEIHHYARGLDYEGVLNAPTTLMLLDAEDTLLNPALHAELITRRYPAAAVNWGHGWHCGWLFAPRRLAAAVDAHYASCGGRLVS